MDILRQGGAFIYSNQAPGDAILIQECGKIAWTFTPGVAKNCNRLHSRNSSFMQKPYFSLTIAGALLFPSVSVATDVSVAGLFSGAAVVTINGGTQKLLRAGEKTPEGVKLIGADSSQAVLEIDGKRMTLGLGQGASMGGAQVSSGQASVTLTADAQGHFITQGSINGNATRFLVDTGATTVAMSSAEARRLGIAYQNGERGFSATANGVAPVYRVSLNNVKVGAISLNGVTGTVHESAMPVVLLGMSFLNRVNMKREGDSMVLTKRF